MFAVGGRCYGSGADAVSAFVASGSGVGPGGAYRVVSASVDSAGLVSYTSELKPFDGGAVQTVSSSVQLESCADTMGVYPVQSVLAVTALVFAALVGFAVGWRT